MNTAVQLTAHFSLEELTRSSYAIRQGIDNSTNDPDVLANLGMLAAALERVRTVLALPIHVDSGYRCPAVNKGVGGSKDSDHMKGLAADIICPAFGSPREIAEALVAQKEFVGYNKLIQEGNWLHVAFSDAPRYEVLTAHFGAGPTTYTRGLA